jgi:hypothetical protein
MYGQEGPDDRIRAYKTAFITDELELTPDEAERFWPVYNKYQDQIDAMRKKERKEIFSKARKLDELTDEEANALIDKGMVYAREQVDLRSQMVDELRGVISPKKVIKLRRVEESFKREMLKRFRDKRGRNNRP